MISMSYSLLRCKEGVTEDSRVIRTLVTVWKNSYAISSTLSTILMKIVMIGTFAIEISYSSCACYIRLIEQSLIFPLFIYLSIYQFVTIDIFFFLSPVQSTLSLTHTMHTRT